MNQHNLVFLINHIQITQKAKCLALVNSVHIWFKQNFQESHQFPQSLIAASKAYKKKMNYSVNKHNKQSQIKLMNLKNKNPKEYWKIVK